MTSDLLHEPVECFLEHHFSDGIYVRQIFMPAGTFVQGKEHKTRHLNVVITGQVLMKSDDGIVTIQAPATFESEPGVSKLLYIHSDTIWQTIHVNEADERDIDTLENRLVQEPVFDGNSVLAIEEFKAEIEGSAKCLS